MAKLPAAQQYIGKGIDLPAPELPGVCCNPSCDAPAFELHHVCRRSFLAGAFNYVELFGRVWLNLAPVCRSCHDDLEQNRVRIVAELKGSSGYYSWGGVHKLDPYPCPVLEDGESAGVFPPFHAEPGSAGSPSSSTGESNPSSNVRGGTGGPPGEEGRAPVLKSGVTEGEQFSRGSESRTHSSGPGALDVPDRPADSPSVTPGSTCPHTALAPGESCPGGCGYRKKHPKKATSPKTVTLGFRVPTDEKESIQAAWLQRAERLGISELPHWPKHYLDITNSLIDGLSDDTVRNIGKDYLGDL